MSTDSKMALFMLGFLVLLAVSVMAAAVPYTKRFNDFRDTCLANGGVPHMPRQAQEWEWLCLDPGAIRRK